MPEDEDEAASRQAVIPRLEDSSTVLPKPVASAISLATKSSALYLRLGTFVGKLAIDGARVTTVTGLELSRAVVERILSSAGEDVVKKSTGEIGRQEAEGLLERSIGRLHSTITHISFAASAGFHLSSAGLAAASDISQHLLITLDSIFGSTDSSRAIASIITLVRREFQNPATGQPGEKVGVVDLLVGVCGLALLQQWCKNSSEQEAQDGHYKDIIWDVVILDDGSRADTGESWLIAAADAGQELRENHTQDVAMNDVGDGSEARLRERIMQSLPPDATVSITTETTTTKVTTVEITGAQPLDLLPPAGAEVIEENAHHFDDGHFAGSQSSSPQSRYRVVYRTTHNQIRGTDVAARDGPDTSFTRPKVEELPDTPTDMDWQPEDAEPLLIEHSPTNTANSKRTRQSHGTLSHQAQSSSGRPSTRTSESTSKMPLSKKAKVDTPNKKGAEKKGTLRDALRKGSQATISNILGKDTPNPASTKTNPPWQMSGVAGASKRPESKTARPPHLPVPDRGSSNMRTRSAPLVPKSSSRRPIDEVQNSHPKIHSRSNSRASYYEVHERRRDSMVSQTDTYSIHSTDTSRASSPTQLRSHVRTQSSLMRSRSGKDLNVIPSSYQRHSKTPEPSPLFAHRSTKSYDPSIYTLKTNNSETSLVLAHLSKGAFDDEESVQLLRRNGSVPGLFPRNHLVRNISRFARFASASYGSNFMRLMGISAPPTGSSAIPDSSHHYEHHSFSSHTQLPSSTILLSSFVDPQGGTDAAGRTGTSVPLVHFISLDHESHAVVLSCRGTLGFEDVLTDMTCDYDDMHLRNRSYRVHKGIYASARRLISGAESRVLATIAAALEEFPTYGLVMCGHSLGGGVVSLLAIMLATPGSDPEHNAFVTTTGPVQSGLPLTTSSNSTDAPPKAISLPAGRPIHVYAYGPPATLSPSLRRLTRGLITTIVNKNDLVPSLSLGVLHDIQAVALAFKSDSTGAASRVRARVWSSLSSGLMEQWYRGDYVHGSGPSEEDDQWAWATLKTLRASMQSEKLVPPGEVFQVETTAVLRRDAFTVDGKDGLGRPATRAVLRYVRDVDAVFGEVQFGGGMLGDHSPGRYENALKTLGKGVLGGFR
ncbi:hypothetical protein V490_08197 [Pseudogymnoascus sp. VKM F-3557]|nr:hypothetical protein V490_08197 [Pseudogymnoascus sp. VKM F-3557]